MRGIEVSAMTHRQRILNALDHKESDRVPIDFGGTYTTTIFHTAYDRLTERLGIDAGETQIYSKTRRLAIPSEAVLQRFDIDTRFVGLSPYEGDQREIDQDTYLDEWGTTWKKADDGHYLYVDGPFFELKRPPLECLDIDHWPDPENPGYYRGLAERARVARASGCAAILNMPIGVIHQGQFLRGFADWLKDLYKNRAFSQRMMEVIAERWIAVAEKALDECAGNVDIVFFGDDLASQLAPLFNPEIYREIIKPLHARMIAAVKAKAEVRVLYHSCGAVTPLIDDLIEIGVDALNPVQVTARDMEPATLKKRWGDSITFWGGINSQQVLPFGTPDEVRAEVRRVIDILALGGGFVLNSVHNIQNDVTADNIIAMFDEASAYQPGSGNYTYAASG
jgi:uroporphyrinogen decarboxylase